MIIQMEKGKQIRITILLCFAILLYYFGYDICHALYNQYEFPVGSVYRQETAKKFWDMRFSNYSIIVAIVLYTQRFKLNKLNLSISRVGFNLAIISAVDKIVFKTLDFSELDIYIFIILILSEIYRNLKTKKATCAIKTKDEN